MSLAAIQSAIYSRFGAQWDFTTYPAVLENQVWSAAAGGKQPTDKAWGRFSVRFSSSRSTTVDAKARRVTGLAWLQIFLPENKGSIVAHKIGDEMERIFGEKVITGGGETIQFERAVTNHVGKTEDGWEQYVSTVPFISDAVTA